VCVYRPKMPDAGDPPVVRLTISIVHALRLQLYALKIEEIAVVSATYDEGRAGKTTSAASVVRIIRTF